ncbi:MAG: molybdate ABC transporter permease subunit [Oscillospiraceae bacterium]|nr:molybdate ABC transporter permease subunit [Oscillospiraceae bacterium]
MTGFDWSPLFATAKIAAAATVLTFVTGIAAARLVMSLKKGRALADALFSLPLVLPPTVTGFILLMLFGRNSPVGHLLDSIGMKVIFTWQGAALAAAAVSFPIMYRTARGAFESVDTDLTDMARILGCSRMDMLIHVWIPLSWHGIASGLTLSFARAVGEFGATIMVAGNLPGRTQTMSVAIYTAMQGGNREMAYIWTAVILLISFVLLALLNILTGRQYSSRSSEKNERPL